MTTTAPVLEPAVMPTEAEMKRAVRLIYRDLSRAMMDISHPVRRIATWQGKEAPTVEDIGRLYLFVRDVERAMVEVETSLTYVRGSLDDLDYVRVNGNVNPDADEPVVS